MWFIVSRKAFHPSMRELFLGLPLLSDRSIAAIEALSPQFYSQQLYAYTFP